jgi:LDH2 family malate/lactate/ureidoglycolate dehydrogenase
MIGVIKETPPADGFQEVLVPGELEAREAEAARRSGIALDGSTIEALRQLGQRESVVFPPPIA